MCNQTNNAVAKEYTTSKVAKPHDTIVDIE